MAILCVGPSIGCYSTISAAVAAANPGDTIMVAAGTYTEVTQIVISKQLTLLGAQAGVDARGRTFPPSPLTESIVKFAFSTGPLNLGLFSLQADGIVIDGFTMTNTASGGGGISSAISTSSTFSGYQIVNTIFTMNDVGIELNSSNSPLLPNLIQHNLFQADFKDGIYTTSNQLFNTLIDSNSFLNGDSEASINLDNAQNITITNNLFENDNSVSLNSTSTTTNTTINIIIANNCFHRTQGTAVFVAGGANLVSILANSFVDGIVGGAAIGVRQNIFNPNVANTNITIQNNNFIHNGRGLFIEAGAYNTGGSTMPLLDAVNNWWNSVQGPGGVPGNTDPDADKIVDQNIPTVVDFIPFATVPFPATGPCMQPMPPTPTPTPTPIIIPSSSILLTDASLLGVESKIQSLSGCKKRHNCDRKEKAHKSSRRGKSEKSCSSSNNHHNVVSILITIKNVGSSQSQPVTVVNKLPRGSEIVALNLLASLSNEFSCVQVPKVFIVDDGRSKHKDHRDSKDGNLIFLIEKVFAMTAVTFLLQITAPTCSSSSSSSSSNNAAENKVEIFSSSPVLVGSSITFVKS